MGPPQTDSQGVRFGRTCEHAVLCLVSCLISWVESQTPATRIANTEFLTFPFCFLKQALESRGV